MSSIEPEFIHPSAVVDTPAVIGKRTKIWHYCHVMAGARIGEDCVLGQNVFIAGSVSVGRGCRIQNNVSLYDGVVLEDDVFLGPSCVLTNVRNPRAGIRRRPFATTLVRQGATLGANCTIVAPCTIGCWAFVGAGCVVLRDIPDYALVVGNPAQHIGWMSRCAERLQFEAGSARCPASGERYQLTAAGIKFLGG